MKRSCLPLPAVQVATTKILPTKCLNIAEPRIFCPPKITRYTVVTRTLATPTCVTVGVDVHTTPQGEAKAPEGGDGGRVYEVQHSTGGDDL